MLEHVLNNFTLRLEVCNTKQLIRLMKCEKLLKKLNSKDEVCI